ncbi:hypothetical protein HX857_20975 [Pseudomonas gingeri]|uniref:hypothetical protein n=1 Tax=Pseudomonas gingeri TaxID=117681 RepID=UPI0015BEAE98|nr:hypothetical protein [Pseudomonas gingeri]NWE71177.1 hypothetical protein [Pseudomonas gingeri]
MVNVDDALSPRVIGFAEVEATGLALEYTVFLEDIFFFAFDEVFVPFPYAMYSSEHFAFLCLEEARFVICAQIYRYCRSGLYVGVDGGHNFGETIGGISELPPYQLFVLVAFRKAFATGVGVAGIPTAEIIELHVNAIGVTKVLVLAHYSGVANEIEAL